jgi:hypothetical protein
MEFDYNQLVQSTLETQKVLPDFGGKLNTLNPIKQSTLMQEKMFRIKGELQESARDIVSSVGIPFDLYEGNSSKWETIKRSDRLQTKVQYLTSMVKTSIIRLAQSLVYHLTGVEIPTSDIQVVLFKRSDVEINAEINKLTSLNELIGTFLQVIGTAERELMQSQLVNKEAFYELIKSQLLEIYPNAEQLLNIDEAINAALNNDNQQMY